MTLPVVAQDEPVEVRLAGLGDVEAE